jgi:hypothetical protein
MPTYLLQHMMPRHFQRCNKMMAHGINQTMNNDDSID